MATDGSILRTLRAHLSASRLSPAEAEEAHEFIDSIRQIERCSSVYAATLARCDGPVGHKSPHLNTDSQVCWADRDALADPAPASSTVGIVIVKLKVDTTEFDAAIAHVHSTLRNLHPIYEK